MAKEPFPSDQQDKFMLRMPRGMRDRIKRAAENNHRSMNAEIISRLEVTMADAVSAARDVMDEDLGDFTPQDLAATQADMESLVLELAKIIERKRNSQQAD